MEIKKLVDNLTKKHKTNNPFDLAHALNINIVYENLGDMMGYFTNDYRIKFIHINKNLNEKESIFTCAHELGHAIQHPAINTPFLKRHTLFSTDKIERQANTFAVELLMPDSLLHEYHEISLYNIAAKFGIPNELVDLKEIKK